MARWIRDEEGYTLLETVVAMSIFLAVTIPLGVVVATMTLDRTPEDLTETLRLAQSEVSRIEGGLTTELGRADGGRLRVRTMFQDTLGARVARVVVSSRSDSTKVLLTLERWILPEPGP